MGGYQLWLAESRRSPDVYQAFAARPQQPGRRAEQARERLCGSRNQDVGRPESLASSKLAGVLRHHSDRG
jgi:hypothetical protein